MANVIGNASPDIQCPITNAPATPVAANLIIITDAANPGNGKLSTAAAQGFLGVTLLGTDRVGVATIRQSGRVKVKTGTAGSYCASDGTGQGVNIAAAVGGGAVKQVVGIFQETVNAGELAEILIQPFHTTG